MIAFDLACACGCQFEGWFQNHADFTRQHEEGLIPCPECGEIGHIRKLLSPVAFLGKGGQELPVIATDDHDPETKTAENMLRMIQNVIKKFENVGADLAKEALKIHFGVTEPRNIRGVATEEEEAELKKEGIELLKIPLPEKEQSH
ncbi:MAG: DUF1178 family protein [Thermodesulfobacteriota bacterium]|nr:DUF1178 family protein [Thermodesulfobacteriota bacterium]